MLVMVLCHDRPDGEALRARLMPAHQRHVEPLLDRFKVGGFLRSVTGGIVGSMAVLDVPDEAAARALFERDPYFGTVWERIDCIAYEPRAGDWIGGKTW